MTRLRYIFFLILSLAIGMANAQELTEKDKIELQKRVKSKIEEFQGYLSSIVNKDLSNQRRNAAKESAIALFMGECEPYFLFDEHGNKEPHREVRMQVSSVTKATTSTKSMKKYLQNTYDNIHNYSKVVIQSADAVRVDNIYKVGEGKYECMAYFGQKYISYGPDGNIIYGDLSKKKVKVHITATEIPTVGIYFDAKLGDIYVDSTEKLPKY